MSPAPELVVLETCFYSDDEYYQARDYYLIKGDWNIEDLKYGGGCILYKGKVVKCPVCVVLCGDFEELSEEEQYAVEFDEYPELTIRDRNGMFEGHTIDEIVITDEDE